MSIHGRRTRAVAAGLALASGLGLALTVGLACTDGGPEPLELESDVGFDGATEPAAAHAPFAHQPELDLADDPDPPPTPRLELIVTADDPDDFHPTEFGACPYEVVAHGLPAVRADGAVIADLWQFGSQETDRDDERLELRWYGTDSVESAGVVDRAVERRPDGTTGDCEAALERVARAVAARNAALAAHRWRPLERLDAFYRDPGFAIAYHEHAGNDDELIASLPGPDRPIEVYYHHQSLVVRVRELAVLLDQPQPGWARPAAEYCSETPKIHAIELDRASRAALARFDYDDGGCFCDGPEQAARIELSPALIDALDQRSTASLATLQREVRESVLR